MNFQLGHHHPFSAPFIDVISRGLFLSTRVRCMSIFSGEWKDNSNWKVRHNTTRLTVARWVCDVTVIRVCRCIEKSVVAIENPVSWVFSLLRYLLSEFWMFVRIVQHSVKLYDFSRRREIYFPSFFRVNVRIVYFATQLTRAQRFFFNILTRGVFPRNHRIV